MLPHCRTAALPHYRIICDGVGPCFQCARDCAQQVEAGDIHLRLATDEIGILHPFFPLDVAFADLGILEQSAEGGAGVDRTPCGRARCEMSGWRGSEEPMAAFVHSAALVNKRRLCGTVDAKQTGEF
jgi:hypothetical protein